MGIGGVTDVGLLRSRTSGPTWSCVMWLETSRFGRIEVDEERLIRFPKGILGFPEQTEYALVQTGPDSVFFWLQAVNRPDLAFVVCDPQLFVQDYCAPIKADEVEALELTDLKDAQLFCIVNKVDGMLTGNLQGPLVVNCKNLLGRQLVLSEKRFTTRHPLLKLPASAEVVSKTA
jgi:flagellar assembly factor FliW